MKAHAIALLILTFIFSPVIVDAFGHEFDGGGGQSVESGNNSGSLGSNPGSSGSLGTNPGTTGSLGTNFGPSQNSGGNSLRNPLQANSITELIFGILDILLIFAIPIIVLFIMYAGFLFVTAAGDSNKIATARVALTWAIVGGVIVLGARSLIAVIQGTISSI